MERSTHHSASHSRAAPPAPSKYNITPRAEQYSEIFDSFRRGRACSIPLLDLPPFDDSSTAFDISGFLYSEIFGGIDILDFALSSDQLFRTQVGTQSQSEESYPSTSLEINNYVLNGDFHQTAASKFNFSYQKVNATEVANDIIFPDVSSGIPVEPQSDSAFAPSRGSFKENGTPNGITLIPTVMSESGPFLTTESRHAPQNSAVTRIKDPVDSMSEYESSKSNYAKSLFHVSTSEFLDAEFDTGSSGIASAEAFKEAMDTAKVKMNSVRELMERKKDGVRPLEINNMNGTERVRMVFHESVSRDEVLQPKHSCDHNLFKVYGKGMQDASETSHVLPDSLEAEKHNTGGAAKPPHQSASRVAWREDNGRGLKDANHLEDNDEACTKKRTEARKRMMSPRGDQQKSDMCLKNAEQGRGKRKNEMCEKEESETKAKDVQEIEQCQNNVEAATVSHCYEEKLIHSVEKKTYEKLLVATTDNRTEQRVDECEDLKSSNLRARLDDQSIKQTAMARDSDDMLKNHVAEVMLKGKRRIKIRSGTVFGDMESKRGEIDSCLMSSQQSETQRIIKDSKHNHQEQSLSSDVSQIVGHKVKAISGNLDPEDIKNSGKFRSLEESQREHLREFKQERRMERERELELEKIKKLQLKKLEESREREKDRMGATAGHDRAYAECDDKAVARQRAMAEARERLEKACANAREKKSLSEKASTEARFRAQYIAAAQERELAIQRQKAMAESHTSSSSDVWICGRSDESEGQKSRARLERHRRTIERVAKALADKSVWDLIAEKEQAEKNSLAESLDGDIKRWSKGKEGNLRALLSTLQYILGPDSGWHWIPLTDIIAPGAVKKAYRKATLCVHPDKLQQRGATVQQKYICEKVFDLLKDSWNKFNLEERLPT